MQTKVNEPSIIYSVQKFPDCHLSSLEDSDDSNEASESHECNTLHHFHKLYLPLHVQLLARHKLKMCQNFYRVTNLTQVVKLKISTCQSQITNENWSKIVALAARGNELTGGPWATSAQVEAARQPARLRVAWRRATCLLATRRVESIMMNG